MAFGCNHDGMRMQLPQLIHIDCSATAAPQDLHFSADGFQVKQKYRTTISIPIRQDFPQDVCFVSYIEIIDGKMFVLSGT
jgi:hypothetical protein